MADEKTAPRPWSVVTGESGDVWIEDASGKTVLGLEYSEGILEEVGLGELIVRAVNEREGHLELLRECRICVKASRDRTDAFGPSFRSEAAEILAKIDKAIESTHDAKEPVHITDPHHPGYSEGSSLGRLDV